MSYRRRSVDPCLHNKGTIKRLVMIIAWVDGCMVIRRKEQLEIEKRGLMGRFECNDEGKLR
jgi:hypothetical protein